MRRAWLLVATALLAPVALAHGGGAPLAGDTLARATDLGSPPARTFETLEAGEAHYHRITLDGDPVRVRLLAPPDAQPDGLVLLIVFGASLPTDTPLPPDVERPEGMGALVFASEDEEVQVDRRLPARHAVLLGRTLTLPAGEYVLVLRAEDASRVALFAEPTRATWIDWAVLPSLRADVRAFHGAPFWMPFLVGGVGAAAVAAVASRWRGRAWPILGILGVLGAAFFAASTALLLADAVAARVVPWALAPAGVALVGASLWAARPREGPTRWRRVALAAAGIAGLLLWSGFLWGPLAALAGALLPEPED